MPKFDSQQRFIVTGASSGIGEGVALLLNELGASVIAVARNRERLESMKSKSAHPENVFLEERDLAQDIDGIPAYVKELKNKYGKFQGLAYCAGVAEVNPIQSVEMENLQRIFNVNYFAPVMMARGFADRRVNNGKGSAAVFISSVAAVVSDKGHTAYAGSKAALSASIRCIAREVAPMGVRMNCLQPSFIATPMGLPWFEQDPENAKKYPLGIGDVSDVANFAAFLLSSESKWITTQNYLVDCGAM